MDIKSTMSEFGFGHRSSRHIIVEHDGELWLTMAPVAVGGFLPMGATTLPGTLKIEPLENGAPAAFTYTATEALLELTAKSGAKVKFAIDKDTQAIRVAGSGAFRLNGVGAAAFVTTLATPDGIKISAGAANYFIVAKKGKISFDDTWILNQFHSVTPVLDVEPEDGGFELYLYDLPADTDVPKITKTLDECAAETAAEFDAFIGTLVDVPAEWDDVKKSIAYPVWLCHRVLGGDCEVIVENKRNSKNTGAVLMSIASMAFKDAKKAIEMILAYPVELPPVAGIAVARLLDEGMINDARGIIFKVYSALETIARKCVNERTIGGEGLSYYAYRFESGQDKSPEFFMAGEPVLAPDLNAYLVIAGEMAGKLANMEYDIGMGQKWEAYARALKTQLIAELWNGEEFVGKNAYTDELSGPDAFLSLIPIVLGSRLPDDIIKKLAAKINEEAIDSSLGLLLVGGLYDAGEKAAAKELIRKALADVRSDGVACPFYGASLLAMAHKVM